MKIWYKVFKIIAICAITALTFSGCYTTDWAAVGDSLTSASNSFANAYSSSSDTGMIYYIYNKSSEWVTVEDLTGDHTIQPGGSISARFNSSATIHDVYYYPWYVNVSQSGFSFTFTD